MDNTLCLPRHSKKQLNSLERGRIGEYLRNVSFSPLLFNLKHKILDEKCFKTLTIGNDNMTASIRKFSFLENKIQKKKRREKSLNRDKNHI